MTIDRYIKDYVENLTSYCPDIDKIWLMGSRANSSAKDDSDWDLLVFGNMNVLYLLRKNTEFNCDDIDILVVYDDNNFKSSWGCNPKRGSLNKWKWTLLSDTKAKYMQHKLIPNEEDTHKFASDYDMIMGRPVSSYAYAYLIWQRQRGFYLEYG